MSAAETTLAVVGGGRWGRVVARVLAEERLAGRVTLVTSHGERACRDWLTRQSGHVRRTVTVEPELPASGAVAAVVATRAATHAAWAARCLSAGLPVLVEKPLAYVDAEDERRLAALADRHGVCVGVNHEFLLAAWAGELREIIARGPAPTGVRITWHEPHSTARHGEVRRADLTTTTVQDLFPHALSLLTATLGEQPLTVEEVVLLPDRNGFRSRLLWGELPVRCEILRNAGTWRRELEVTRSTGAPALHVDWRTEPARLTASDGTDVTLGAGRPGALVRALSAFVRHVQAPDREPFPLSLSSAHHLLHGVRTMEQAVSRVSARLMAQVHSPDTDTPAVAAALVTRIAERAERVGLVERADDWDAVHGWAHRLLGVAKRLGTAPFTPLEELCAASGLDRRSFGRMMEIFQETPELRAAVTEGPSAKFWQNTTLPMERAGVFDAVLAGKPRFPHRIGLYAGVTCMFRCAFCIRADGARYETSTITPGTDLMAAVIDEAPLDNPTTFYVSGGLEPLTNPRLGQLVQRAARRGFRVTCYTNGFALTPHTLERQPGLWDLDAVRLSLYGIDDEEYRSVTTRSGAFARVRDNARNLLALRRRREAPLRIGLNYVVLPNRVDRVPKVIEYIAHLNEAAPDRPVDFLTLREDYSGRPAGELTAEERVELAEVVQRTEEAARRLTPGLRIDWGYALHGARYARVSRLPEIAPETMLPGAYPQAAVVVDLLGDVYLYQEAAFPGLAGADRYVIGRLAPGRGLYDIVDDFVRGERVIRPVAGDQRFLDAFDQVVTARIHQLRADVAAGWGRLRGALR